jgi:hypothetical protein
VFIQTHISDRSDERQRFPSRDFAQFSIHRTRFASLTIPYGIVVMQSNTHEFFPHARRIPSMKLTVHSQLQSGKNQTDRLRKEEQSATINQILEQEMIAASAAAKTKEDE